MRKLNQINIVFGGSEGKGYRVLLFLNGTRIADVFFKLECAAIDYINNFCKHSPLVKGLN